ncbi:glycosyltransferase family 9 protein [Candidatus Pacearchaeota archaeon]|nr:glycosyltransferase family 9 protein [Candidatus Pacearchaeota archaeon]
MKICIIKLGAFGDVVRTLPILIGIKEKYPDSEISWITKKESSEIINSSPYVRKIYTLPDDITEFFDILYNFDIDDEATSLAKKLQAGQKYGFYSDNGFVLAFNIGAEYYLNTLFDDETKKTNKKTYQEMMFMTAELSYKKQHHPVFLSDKDVKYAKIFFRENQINPEKIIGIHLGASPRWPSKVWHKENLKEFVKKAMSNDFEIILFGGPNEIKEIEELRKETGIKTNNPNNSIMEFASLVDRCNFMVCSDSFSLHISLALKKPTIGLFFCTSPNEVESYEFLKKIVSPMLYNFFPEKMDEYDEELVKSISADEVLDMIIEMNNTNK